ncbi:MAG: hypothetical protein CMJ84_09480 [Planctomycetes bacterium]|jgi:arylsulfatase A-like enzyme|nr:hypothetical protein [Planctomycetota bacterium]MDP6409563.1 sulfatase [Planctomycetota bacterium]
MVGRDRLLGFVSLLAAACSGGDAPAGRIDLSRGFAPAEARVEVEIEIERADWEALGDGIWRTRMLVPTYRAENAATRPTLAVGERELTLFDRRWASALWARLPDGVDADMRAAFLDRLPRESTFSVARDTAFLVLRDTDELFEQATLRLALELGAEQDGFWRVALGPLKANGIPLFPGRAEELSIDLPANGLLRFATAAFGHTEDGRPVRFRVLVDGRTSFEVEQPLDECVRAQRHVVRLDGTRRPGATLRFEVDGPPCVAAFLNPVLEREPPDDPRLPNVVLVSADTFRADNLAVYGGLPELTPHLNRFAEGARVVRVAHATSSWTLPSHASMLAGLYPHQAAADTRASRLSEDARTLAEVLREHGYRTGAVTERGFVSRTYGLDQGFEWFHEEQGPVESTLELFEELLDADDGRPFFLFFHSYRAHHPYVVSPRTRERLGAQLGLAGLPDDPPAQTPTADLLALYRGGSADMDAAFGALWSMLRARGLLADTFVVFTSDHGEAFGEHGVQRHGSGVWEELVRVPLIVSGPGVAAGFVDGPRSLASVPTTICELLGLPPWPAWSGPGALAAAGPGAVYAFQCSGGAPNHAAIIAGQRKVIATTSRGDSGLADLAHAYDLSRDPAERRDLADSEVAWPRELMQRFSERERFLFEATVGGAAAAVSQEQEDELRAMGYAGD